MQCGPKRGMTRPFIEQITMFQRRGKITLVRKQVRADANTDVETLDGFWNPNHVPAIRAVQPPILASPGRGSARP
jgi:hypothetical protein